MRFFNYSRFSYSFVILKESINKYMSMNQNESEHSFGGAWTELKLEILGKYLHFYTTALKDKFELLYIDAFAGTGTRIEKSPELPLLNEEEEKVIYKGSAKIALEIEKKFDRYLFIEKNTKRYNELKELREEYPDLYIRVTNNDANQEIQRICNKPILKSGKYRGVIFLDPYGNSVEWKTLESISQTESFDIWFLFPLSGVYRQASHDFNKVEEYKKENLNKMFGTEAWVDAFYKKQTEQDLFGENEKTERINIQEIEAWVQSRLKDCFSHVSKPLPLPIEGTQMFSLFFCTSNKSGKAIGLALKVANHILKQHEK